MSRSRREFLIQSAAAALASIAGCGDNARRRRPSPNSRLGIGIIGVGGFGQSSWILGTVLAHPQLELIAVADVDANHRDTVVANHGVAGYVDYNDLLARPDIDAVYIITPHHQHALPAIHAARAGKHIYCDKPLTLTVAEGRAMASAVRGNDVTFQTGSQQRSNREFLIACELVRNGRVGQLHEVHVGIGFGPARPPEPANPLPDTLDWDRWLGPAPFVEYHQARVHGTYRYFYDYGGGMVTDIGAHMLDIAQWALDRDDSGPDTIEATAVYAGGSMYEEPVSVDAALTYGDVNVRVSSADWGVRFRGSDGEVFITRGFLEASRPELLDWEPGSGDVVLEQSTDHHQNWIDAIYNGGIPICDVEVGHRSASACHLVNIAIQTGRRLTWDAARERFVNDLDADALLSRPSRKGYSY